MRCRQAKTLLALHAGGDLPENQVEGLTTHLARCPGCASELKAMQHALAAVSEMSRSDQPDPLPSDFAQQVLRKARATPAPATLTPATPTRPGPPSLHRWLGWRPGLRLAFGGVALAAVVVLLVLWYSSQPADPAGRQPIMSQSRIIENQPPEVRWQELHEQFTDCLEGPYRLDTWEAPSQAGVIAILHKPDPENKPDTYVIDYCAEGRRLSAGGSYPWLKQRARRLVNRAGSADNLYIAVCLMRGSDRHDRRAVRRALISQYNPFFNQRGGA